MSAREGEELDADDDRYMAMALEAAARVPYTAPNPRVGAVLVSKGEVLAAGYHRGPGTPHAEIAALNGIDARGGTLYVTLEPCAHHGRTGPCAPAVAAAGVERVVVAIEDPNPRVRGRGLAILKRSGIDVTTGVRAAEARRLVAGYLHLCATGTPLVTLKLALTIDGYLSASDGTSRWITGEEARRRAHHRRAEVDAVMVGAGTVCSDDPALTVRDAPADRQPARVVVDAAGRVSAGARVFDGTAPVFVATTARAPHETQTAWKEAGAEVLVLPESGPGVDLRELIERFGKLSWHEVYCEGGARLATALLDLDLVGRLEINYGPVMTGGGAGIGELGVGTMEAARRWTTASVERAGDDVVWILEPRPPAEAGEA